MAINVRRCMVAVLWLVGSVSSGVTSTPSLRKQAPPKRMLWSWFAEDDFRPLADQDIGVAYLALSLQFEGQNNVTPSPRNVAVQIPPKMYQLAVVRFDNAFGSGHKPAFSQRQRQLAVSMIAEIAAITKPQTIQIDFDAPQSAWPFYRQLLSEVRTRIGPDLFLSITALVSWCEASNSWLAGRLLMKLCPWLSIWGRRRQQPSRCSNGAGSLDLPAVVGRSALL